MPTSPPVPSAQNVSFTIGDGRIEVEQIASYPRLDAFDWQEYRLVQKESGPTPDLVDHDDWAGTDPGDSDRDIRH